MDVRDFFNQFHREYEKQRRDKHLFYNSIMDSIADSIENEKSVILDFGTGCGELAKRLANRYPKAKITGIDISERMIDQAIKNNNKINNVSFIVSSIEKCGEIKRDTIVSSFALHHIKDKNKIISRMFDTLPKEGKLIIGDWFKPSIRYKWRTQKFRNSNSRRYFEFKRSWEEFLNDIDENYSKEHPIEYPVCPIQMKHIMDNIGFSNTRIIPFPLPNFAVVIGIK